tara:strand:+ start:259 stop:429 length:171 start_codon:yes stop_codon:yes gene_type:complete
MSNEPTIKKIMGSYSGKPHWRIDYPVPQPDGAKAAVFRTKRDAMEELKEWRKNNEQ